MTCRLRKRTFNVRLLITIVLLIVLGTPSALQALTSLNMMSLFTWSAQRFPTPVWPGDGAAYYRIHTDNGSRAHVIVVNLASGKWTLRPALSQPPARTSVTARREDASAAINGGFFNTTDSSGASLCYVVIDGHTVANPQNNKGLMRDRKLAPYLKAILNRSEFRILKDVQGKLSVDIAKHDEPIPQGMRLAHSLQAGPRLLPKVTLREEAFVRTDSRGNTADPIRSTEWAARTAIGITREGKVLLVCVAGPEQDSSSPGITISGLARLMKTLGCIEALNLDGGSSTSMFVTFGKSNSARSSQPAGAVPCGMSPERKVKSVLLLLPLGHRPK